MVEQAQSASPRRAEETVEEVRMLAALRTLAQDPRAVTATDRSRRVWASLLVDAANLIPPERTDAHRQLALFGALLDDEGLAVVAQHQGLGARSPAIATPDDAALLAKTIAAAQDSVRAELLGKRASEQQELAKMSAAEIEAALRHEEATQETYKEEMAAMSATLRELAQRQSSQVTAGSQLVDAVDDSLDENAAAVAKENKRLTALATAAGRATLCYWLIVALAAAAFVMTVIFMRVVGKPTV
jgi:hypothetical protein